MEESRTSNALKNVKTGAIVQIINKIMIFVVRTVFIKVLNTEYLGVNGLFTNILMILSFAELGIGTAIIYNMYKPVANNEIEKIKSLMYLYKKTYNLIGIIVFGLGLLFIPFLGYVVKDVPNIKENVIFIYLLFLINTSTSYFYIYKKSIISAHQKESIINNIDSFAYFIKSIVEIIFLIITKNYIIYLFLEIFSVITENIVISKKADKMYPYLKDKNVVKLSKDEKKNIFSHVRSLVVYKFGTVIMNGTDNILISSLINVSSVGLTSNYTMIINSIRAIVVSALNGVTASVGNLNAIGDVKNKEKVFYQMTFINYIIFSFCAIAFLTLINPFIEIWLGSEYQLEIGVGIALAVSFYIDGVRYPGWIFRTTLGLFQKAKSTPYIGAITNIIFSIILGKLLGVTGIFIATSIAQLVSYTWIDPYLIHKYEFNTSSKKYLKKYIIYSIVFIINILCCLWICNLIQIRSFLGLILKGAVVVVLPNFVNIIIFYKSEEFRSLYKKFIKK